MADTNHILVTTVDADFNVNYYLVPDSHKYLPHLAKFIVSLDGASDTCYPLETFELELDFSPVGKFADCHIGNDFSCIRLSSGTNIATIVTIPFTF